MDNGCCWLREDINAHLISELCLKRGIIVSTFFFARSDSSRNTIHAVAPTIAYQLYQQIPAARPIIVSAIRDNPLLFELSFNAQFQALVIKPLLHIQETIGGSQTWSILILFDGLDECPGMERQQIILVKTITEQFRRSPTLPLTALITSRPRASPVNAI